MLFNLVHFTDKEGAGVSEEKEAVCLELLGILFPSCIWEEKERSFKNKVCISMLDNDLFLYFQNVWFLCII